MLKQIPKTAWLFPGQGSQEVGMGRALFSAFPQADEIFLLAEEYSGLPLKTVCTRGPDSTLVQTNYLQPTLVALSISFVDYLKQHGLKPDIVAGHSLGELSALYAADVLGVHDVIRLATERGRLMAESANGGMMAIKDLPVAVVEQAISENSEGVVVAANFNTPQQLVISGDIAALDSLIPRLSEKGGVCIRLNVQGAWHSPLVASAANAFCKTIEEVEFRAPSCQLVMGMTAQIESCPHRIRELMMSQICSPVRWFEVMRQISAFGATRYVEVGSGKVLKGLMRKIFDDAGQYDMLGVDNSRFLKEVADGGAYA